MPLSNANFNPSKPFSSLTAPRLYSPLGPSMGNTSNFRIVDNSTKISRNTTLGPPYKAPLPSSGGIQIPQINYSNTLFQSIKNGFGFGVGSSIARSFFESKVKVEESKTLEASQPNPPNGNSIPPPILPPSENISRLQNSIQQTQNSSSCSNLETEYTLCIERNSIEICTDLEKKYNACLASKK